MVALCFAGRFLACLLCVCFYFLVRAIPWIRSQNTAIECNISSLISIFSYWGIKYLLPFVKLKYFSSTGQFISLFLENTCWNRIYFQRRVTAMMLFFTKKVIIFITSIWIKNFKWLSLHNQLSSINPEISSSFLYVC